MSQVLNLRVKGLYLNPNNLSEVPDGALNRADNIVIDKDSVAESRRGFKTYGNVFSVGSGKINQIFHYRNKILAHYDNKFAYDSDDAGTWTNYSGTYSAPDSDYRLRSIEANRNFYFNSSNGIKKLDSVTGTIVDAGGVKALDGVGSTTGASGFLSDSKSVAYRLVWGYKDANKNLILGAPSQRVVVANTSGGTRDISLTFTIPSGITTSWFYQLYRSGESASLLDEPNDELQLVVEGNPTSTDITNKSVTITDSTPNSLRGASLYTNPSQEGIAQANEVPPFCKDMCVFKDHAFYANVKSKHRLYVTLISVGGSGLVVNDTIAIGGVTYTAKATENAAAGEFEVYTAGTPAENIESTALSLVAVINKYASNTSIYAYYISGFDDLPGKILLEERGVGGSSFAAISSRGTAFNPALPTSGTSVSSDNETKLNRVFISKVKQPEAVPLLNYLDIGSADEPIMRILALRDSIFVFKSDGIFRITGEDVSTFRVNSFDNTVQLKASESAVVFNNQVFAFTDQGVVAVSDTGVQVVSRQIESTLLELSSPLYENFETATFGISYESERKYILFTVSATGDEDAKQAFVYNSFTNSWTRWIMTRTCGLVNPRDNKLYLASSTNNYLYQERKDFELTDYADDEYPVTISSVSGTTITLSSTSDVVAGMTLKQSGREAVVLSVEDATTITVDKTLSWSAGSAKVYTPIRCRIEWVPQHTQNPGVMKHFRELTLFFKDASFREIDVEFATNFSLYTETVTVTPVTSGPWGQFPWGTVAWGGGYGGTQPIRTFFPLEKQRGMWTILGVTNEQSFTTFSLSGLSLVFSHMSERFK